MVFSLLAMGISPAHAANEIRIVVTGPDADGITNIGYCFTDARALSGTVSFVATSSYGAFLAHSEMPNCPSMVGSSTGQRLTEGTTYAFTVTATNGGNTFTDSLNYTAPAQPAPRVTPSPITTPAPESSTASTPSISETVTAPNSKVNVGIWLISGRTSEIYGRGDGIADSQSQIQWVTCLESLSGPMLYPNRDNLNYTYTVTGPAGVVATGDYAPTWIDSMSSCTGNSGGSQYTAAYNLTGLIPGTTYQFAVSGSNAGSSFTSTKSFTTMSASPVSPINNPTTPETKTVTSETSTSVVTPETSTPISTPTPTPSPTPTATPAPVSEPRGLGGYAVIHPDGHVCGVIVGNSYFGNNDRTMTSEYMGCPVGSPIIFQTKPSPTGNVAGWHGSNVTYNNGVFTITNNGEVAMTISDGIATDSTGRMWDTGSGVTLRAGTVITPPTPPQSDTATATSAPSSTIFETPTAMARVETTTVTMPVAIPAPDEDLSTLDEIFPEEEIVDSIIAVVQTNKTTRIEVSTGYALTSMTVVATKKGSKKKYTYKITTNADGDRKFKSGINLRGYTVVLYKGSTELDRMYIS